MQEVLFSPVLFVLFLAFAILFPKSKNGRRLGIAGALLFFIFSTPLISGLILTSLEHRLPALSLREKGLEARADAIVVLGGGRYAEAPEYENKSTVSISSLARLRYAAMLARTVKKPILVSGGSPLWSGDAEALLMKKSLEEDFLVPVKWTESESRNTRENAKYSAKILLALGVRRIFLVTHASHMMRSKRSFEAAGFSVVPAPLGFASFPRSFSLGDLLPSVKGMEFSQIAAHESIGELWYELRRRVKEE